MQDFCLRMTKNGREMNEGRVNGTAETALTEEPDISNTVRPEIRKMLHISTN